MDWAFVVVDNAVVQDAPPNTKRPDDDYLQGARKCPPRVAGDARDRGWIGDRPGHGPQGHLVLQLQFIRTLANPDREPRGDAPNHLANSQEMPEISDLYG